MLDGAEFALEVDLGAGLRGGGQPGLVHDGGLHLRVAVVVHLVGVVHLNV